MRIIFPGQRGNLTAETLQKWTESLCQNAPASFGALCVTKDGIAFPWLCYNAGELSGAADIYDEQGSPVTFSYVSSILSGAKSSGAYDLKPIDFPDKALESLQESLRNASHILRIEEMPTPFLQVLEKLYWNFGHIPAVRDLYNEAQQFWKLFSGQNSRILDMMKKWNEIHEKTDRLLNSDAPEKRQAEADLLELRRMLRKSLKVPKPRRNYLKTDLTALDVSGLTFAPRIGQLYHAGLMAEVRLHGESTFQDAWFYIDEFQKSIDKAIDRLKAHEEEFDIYTPEQRKQLLDLLEDMKINLLLLSL